MPHDLATLTARVTNTQRQHSISNEIQNQYNNENFPNILFDHIIAVNMKQQEIIGMP